MSGFVDNYSRIVADMDDYLGDVPAEFVIAREPPSRWTFDYVLERLVHACSVIANTPYNHPGKLKSAWPPYIQDFADAVAQVSGPEKVEVRARPPGPTNKDFDLMNEAIFWPMHYLKGDGVVVVRWASDRVNDSDSGSGYPDLLIAQAQIIAEGLIADGVPVR